MYRISLLVLLSVFLFGCKKGLFITPNRVVKASVGVNEDYSYVLMVNADEDQVELTTPPQHADTSEFYLDSTELYPYSYYYSSINNYSGEEIIEFKIKRASSSSNFDLPEEETVKLILTIE